MGNLIFILGKSGQPYQFTPYDIKSTFPSYAAVYVYVSSRLQGIKNCAHPYLYIGEAEDLKVRMAAHLSGNDRGRHVCAMEHGADHLLIHYAPNPFFAQGINCHTPKAYVSEVQNDLLHLYNTPCNTQHNTWAEETDTNQES